MTITLMLTKISLLLTGVLASVSGFCFQQYPGSELNKKSWVHYDSAAHVGGIKEGDTVFLIRPMTIIREHYDNGPNDYLEPPDPPLQGKYKFAQLDSVIPYFEKALKRKLRRSRHLSVASVSSNEVLLQYFYNRNSELKDFEEKSFSIDSSFMYNIRQLLIWEKRNVRFVMITYFVWNYGDLKYVWKRKGPGAKAYGGALGYFNMRYLIMDIKEKRVLVDSYSHQDSPDYFPWDYYRFEAYLNPSLRPFLKIVQKRKRVKA